MLGSGTSGDPYIIENISDFQDISLHPDAYYELGHDINAVGFSFTPIDEEFSGSLDGKNYTISHLSISGSGTICIFDYVTGTVKNLKLTDINYSGTGGGSVSGITASNSGAISNCHVTGDITNTLSASGICDYNHDIGVIEYCSAEVNVRSASMYASGFCDGNEGLIQYCYAAGTVTSDVRDASGFCDDNSGIIKKCFASGNVNSARDGAGFCQSIYGTCEDCYSVGNVTCIRDAGGFVDVMYGPTIWGPGVLYHCYSTGHVSGGGTIGGFIASISGAPTITSCFWDIETSGTPISAGGTGKTTADMKTESTFSGWNFETIWNLNSLCNAGYPCLLETTPSCSFLPQITNISYTAKHIVTLEALRNIEMSALGRVYVDEEGRATYKSRYARNR